MTLTSVVGWAWLLTVIFAVKLARRRGIPLLEVFSPIKSFKAFFFQIVILGVAFALLFFERFSQLSFLGQRVGEYGLLLTLAYAWFCIGYHLWPAGSSDFG